MKKSIKTISIIAAMGIMLVCAYLLGTTQAKTITEIHTVTETREVVPDGYVVMDAAVFHYNYVDMRQVTDFKADNDGLQLYFGDGTGYYWER